MHFRKKKKDGDKIKYTRCCICKSNSMSLQPTQKEKTYKLIFKNSSQRRKRGNFGIFHCVEAFSEEKEGIVGLFEEKSWKK